MSRKLVPVALSLALLSACSTTAPGPVDARNSILTQGNVQMNLKVGVTTKADVLNSFGSPNITTRDATGEEVWSYQRQATVSQSSESGSYWSIFLTGESKSAAGLSQSSRMMTLIITFNKNDVVSDFRSRSSDF
jgi:outer membrane protein assembly factor BamE (lipoprotein component of BamABCDE complex)